MAAEGARTRLQWRNLGLQVVRHCFEVLPGACGKRLPRAAGSLPFAHASHQLHVGYFGEAGSQLPLVLCTRCGAHGTTRAAKLAVPCPAAGGTAVPRSAPHRKQASLVARGWHPSRQPRTPLCHVRPLHTRGAPDSVATTAGGAPAAGTPANSQGYKRGPPGAVAPPPRSRRRLQDAVTEPRGQGDPGGDRAAVLAAAVMRLTADEALEDAQLAAGRPQEDADDDVFELSYELE